MVTGTMEDALVYNGTECYKYVSNGKEANDVTGLTLKNAPLPVYARGYVLYSDGTNEGIVYTDVVSVD